MNAAPRCQGVLIAFSAQPAGKLVGAIPGKDQVGVGVDEAGEHRPPFAIEERKPAVLGGDLGFRSGPDHPAVDNGHGRALNGAHQVGRSRRVGDQLPDGGEEDVGHGGRLSA